MSALENLDFVMNPQTRCACALILDTSGSMLGPKIDALNAGLLTFRDELTQDEIASKVVEVAIVEFNTAPRVVQDFVSAQQFHPPVLSATGMTDLAGGVNQALDLIQRRKRQYASHGVPFCRPLAFLITDAEVADCSEIAKRIRDDELNKRVAFFTIGVEGANKDCLKQIGVRPYKMLAGTKFRELFIWLSRSLHLISVSVQDTPGEMTPLDKNTFGWEMI
jgi:uncharacterized protein YegL